jgi:hypothetical protein
MNRFSCIFSIACLSLISPASISSGGQYDWAPITDADRRLAADSLNGRDAIMIFDHVIMDDRSLNYHKCIFEVYRRIKLFTPEGKKWAEVSIRYGDDEETEEIQARSIQPDGQIVQLDPTAIQETELVKIEDAALHQQSFSIPGVSAGSIVEYHYKIHSREPKHIWLFQKEIPLIHGECRWYYFRGSGGNLSWFLRLLGYSPQYLWLNSSKNMGTTELRPSKDDPEYIHFSVDSIPAFQSEPYALADGAIMMQIRCYYGSLLSPQQYWGDLSRSIRKYMVDPFLKDIDPLTKIVAGFPGTDQERASAAFQWLRMHIRNTALMRAKEKKDENENVEGVIDHGYGTTMDINLTFHGMLRAMGIKSKFVLATDHRDKSFIFQAKFFQFDCSCVVIYPQNQKELFCSPGDPALPFGFVPWYIEGTQGLFIGSGIGSFDVIPPSPMDSSAIRRSVMLRVAEDLSISGIVTETLTGHSTESLRRELYDQAKETSQSIIEEHLKERHPDVIIDSLQISGAEIAATSLKIGAYVRFPPLQRTIGNDVQVRPLSYIRRSANPFQKAERIHPISMKFAEHVKEQVCLELPQGWTITSTPPAIYLSNEIGRVVARTEMSENILKCVRSFYTERAYWPESQYASIQALFQRYDESTDLFYIVKPK